MADRVHPRDSSPSSPEFKPPAPSSPEHHPRPPQSPMKPPDSLPDKSVPPLPGTYVIKIPKDQVYRVPPPENAKRFEKLSRKKPRRSAFCCCFCWFLGLLLTLVILAGIAAAVLYLVFRPKAPKYSIDSISIKGFNLSSSVPLSPEFDVTVRADNPNGKIGIDYRSGSSVNIFYDDVKLCNGKLPVFYQPSNNVTLFVTALKGSGIELASEVHKALVDGENKGTVPFKVKIRAPVKIKVGSVKTWKMTVKVNCDVSVDKLKSNAQILSKDCDYGVDLW